MATERHGLSGILGSATPDLLDAFLESVGDAVYVVDADGRVVFANGVALDLLGFTEEELLGRPSHATVHHKRPDGAPYPESECPLLRPRTTGEIVRVDDDWFVRRDGDFVPVAYSSAPVATAAGRGAVVVFRDMRERLKVEELRAREALEHGRAEEVRASRARIVAATDAERRRLGRDLHDGAQQRLTNVVVTLQLAATAAEDERARLVDEALGETQRAIRELRDFAAGLHPAILTSRGLAAAVRSLTARAPMPVGVEMPDGRLPEVIEATAYFVIAEALANVTKHAHATEATVRVDVAADRVVIEVADDGRGGARPGGGSGLTSLTDRVAALDGVLTVTSPPGEGTRVRAELPLGAAS
jgi:PAS domain S-box-containing protein